MLGICFDDMGSGKGQAARDMFIPLAIVVFGCFFLCCRNTSCSVKGIEGPPLMVTLQRVQATSSFEASHCCWGCLIQASKLGALSSHSPVFLI